MPANNVIRALFTRLGFKVDDKGARQYEVRTEKVKATIERIGKGIDKVTRGIATSVAAATASLAGLNAFISGQDEAARQINAFSEATGVNSDRLQQLGFVARQAGVEFEDFGQAFADIGERARDAVKNGGEYQEFFTALGVTLVDTGGNMRSVEQISLDTFEALRKQGGSAEGVLNGMGLLGDNYVRLSPLIALGTEEIERQAASSEALASVYSQDVIKATRDLTNEKKLLRDAAVNLANGFLTAVAPALLAGAKAVREFLSDGERMNRVISVVKAAGVAIAGAFASSVISGFIQVLAYVPALLYNAARAALTTGGAFGVLRAALGFLPILLGGAVIALRDIYQWMNGGDSVIGAFVEKFAGASGIMGDLARAIQSAAPMLAGLFETLMQLAQQALPVLLEGASHLATALIGAAKAILPVVIDVVSTVGGLLSSAMTTLMPLIQSTLAMIVEQLPMIVGLVATVVQSILAIVVPLWPALVAVIQAGLRILQTLIPVVATVAQTIAGLIQSLLPLIIPVVEMIANRIAFVADVFSAVFDFIAGLLGPAVRVIASWVDRISGWIDDILSAARKAAKFVSKIPGFGGVADVFGSAGDRSSARSSIEADFARQASAGMSSRSDNRQFSVTQNIQQSFTTAQGLGPREIERASQGGFNDAGTGLESRLARAAG